MADSSRDCAGWTMLILRVLLGSTFILHGSQKVLGAFGGPGLAGFSGFLQKQFAVPAFYSYLASFVEFVGGWLVLLGVLTELAALAIAVDMLIAIYLVHFAAGYFAPKGFEYPFNLFLVSVALILGGPGRWAIWDPVGRWRHGVT